MRTTHSSLADRLRRHWEQATEPNLAMDLYAAAVTLERIFVDDATVMHALLRDKGWHRIRVFGREDVFAKGNMTMTHTEAANWLAALGVWPADTAEGA
jgi:hypothetical protein